MQLQTFYTLKIALVGPAWDSDRNKTEAPAEGSWEALRAELESILPWRQKCALWVFDDLASAEEEVLRRGWRQTPSKIALLHPQVVEVCGKKILVPGRLRKKPPKKPGRGLNIQVSPRAFRRGVQYG